MKRVISEDGEVFYADILENPRKIIIYKKVKKKKFCWQKSKYEFVGKERYSDANLLEFKRMCNRIISRYTSRCEEKTKIENWDGFLGDDESPIKKKIMRDKKLKKLLNGDTSKLEEFLNSDT